MHRLRWMILPLAIVIAWNVHLARAQDAAGSLHTADVIYGHKDGMALTLDVFRPEKQNGAGVLWMVSGGWTSSHSAVNPGLARAFTGRGFTVFQVKHGSAPRYQVSDIIQDIQRATRFVRVHAGEYGIAPDRLGISGGSSGGHLSLMQGTMGEDGNPDARDELERSGSRVQAVACFYPPTDFLNYAEADRFVVDVPMLERFLPAIGLAQLKEREAQTALARRLSPITHVTSRTPPTLIAHGDADQLVPLQQSQLFMAKLESVGVPHKLIVRAGGGHGWQGMDKELGDFADWFEQYLVPK